MTIQTIKDKIGDTLEKCNTATSRSGHVIERVGRLLEANVDPEVIALQMTKNSSTGYKYTSRDVRAFGALYRDSSYRTSLLSKEQTTALIKDQKEQIISPDIAVA